MKIPPFWDQLTNRRPRAPGRGANVVVISASSAAARTRVVVSALARLRAPDYVIFANQNDSNEYVQFARNSDGTLLMEVASGEYTKDAPVRLIESELAVSTLSHLGLEARRGENFSAAAVTAEPDEIAEWVELIFLNLFRLDENFTLDVLGAPRPRRSADGTS